MAEKRARMKRPAPLADLMAALFHGKPVERRLEEGKIWLVWEAAVGPQVAAKARPASFRDGMLTVAVANAPWMQQLTFLKAAMIAKINERLGRDLVRDIYLKAGMAAAPVPAARPHMAKKRPLAGAEQQRISQQTATVADPELREVLANLLARHLVNEKPSG